METLSLTDFSSRLYYDTLEMHRYRRLEQSLFKAQNRLLFCYNFYNHPMSTKGLKRIYTKEYISLKIKSKIYLVIFIVLFYC